MNIKWIKCTETQPVYLGWYKTYSPIAGQDLCYWDGRNWYDANEIGCQPTHWHENIPNPVIVNATKKT